MDQLDIDMLSFETIGTRKIVSKLREENDKNILINTFSDMDEEMPDPEQVDFLDKIEYVTGYGRNYISAIKRNRRLLLVPY